MNRSNGRKGTARALTTTLLVVAQAALAQEPFRGLDAYIANAANTAKIPGMAVAIVRNDSVIYAKGFGVLSVGSTMPVNERTLFEIGSASKSFTATIVAMLVSDGRMSFDDPVSKYLPDLKLADPIASANLTLRDALTHRSGIGRAGDALWAGTTMSREEMLHRARFIPTESFFRSKYAYANVMYIAAGEASGAAAGSTWDELVQQRIFRPLGMTSSLPTYGGIQTTNIAKGHSRVGDSLVARPPFNGSGNHGIAPAGSILSSAQDMAQWLRFQLNDGLVNGKRLVNSATLRETHTPQIIIGPGNAGLGDGEFTNFNTYGMGWFIQDYRGQLMWQHGGNTSAMTSAMGILPNQKLGVVVLSNMAQSRVPWQLMRYIFDRTLAAAPVRDYVAEGLPRTGRGGGEFNAPTPTQAAHTAGPIPFPRLSYTGTYTDSLLGDIVIGLQNGELYATRGETTGPLEYWNATNFRWNGDGGGRYLKFDVTPDDRITGLYYGAAGASTRFTKKAAGNGDRGGRGER